MRYLLRIYVLLTLSFLLTALPLAAEQSFNEVEVRANFNVLSQLASGSGNLNSSQQHSRVHSGGIRAFKLKTSLRGLGRVEIILDRRRKRSSAKSGFLSGAKFLSDDSEPALLKGRLMSAEGVFPASASILSGSNGQTLQVYISGKRLGRKRLNSYLLSIDLNGSGHKKVARVVKTPYLNSLACAQQASVQPLELQGEYQAQQQAEAVNMRVLEISVHADAEWYQRFGTQSNQQILSVLNAAETIYESQLGVTFDIVNTVTLMTNPALLTTTDPMVLVSNFGKFIQEQGLGGTADILHLFSGKNFDGSVVGVAYRGTVCHSSYSSFKVGIDQHYSSLTHLIVAHELGHNFDAPHDDVTLPKTIMSSVLGSTYNQFSQTSIDLMNNFIALRGGCLTTTSVQTTPTPTKTATRTPTRTATRTATRTPTKTATFTPSPQITAVSTATGTPLPEAPTPVATVTQTATQTATNTPSATYTFTPSATQTAVATATPRKGKGKRHKIEGRLIIASLSASLSNKKSKQRLLFTDLETGEIYSKRLGSGLSFSLRLPEGSYSAGYEIRQGKLSQIIGDLKTFEVPSPDQELKLKITQRSLKKRAKRAGRK